MKYFPIKLKEDILEKNWVMDTKVEDCSDEVLSVNKKKYRNSLLCVLISFIFIFGLVSFRILTNWEALMLDPMTYGWDFFFALLIFVIFISLILFEDKHEVMTLIISSLIPLFWEAFVEVFGWYFKLWEFAKHETEIEIVFFFALQLGLEFYAFYYLIGMFYVLLYKSQIKYKHHYIFSIFFILTILGWIGDLTIAMFDTYVLTFFVWLILNSLHLLSVIKCYNHLNGEKDSKIIN
ncbi:MAG: hypothetical protein EU548_02485 [Promethearchaeota archaeon]|nr:MAG: hypothetical protein EU548_02485 [Candidatus Lokiarchaeota archaeon]